MAGQIQLDAILRFVGVQVNGQIFSNLSRAAAGLPGPIQGMNQQLQQVPGNVAGATRSVRGLNNQLSSGERAAKLFLQRMTQFAILLPTFATMNHAIQGGVKFLFDFDAVLHDIVRTDIGTLSGKFEELSKAAFSIGREFGASAVEAATAMKTFFQAGQDMEQAIQSARLAILATRSSTLETGQAVEFLLAATSQFKLEGRALADALDGLIKVEDLSAVEARDIADAFRTGGDALANFGKDINDAIGLIAAIRQQTRKSGSEIGTFLTAIQARIFAAGDARTAVEQLGVSVQNLDGTLRPTLDVLKDIEGAFNGLTEAQQGNAAKAIAGVRQFSLLLGTLKAVDNATINSVTSSRASGTAKEKEALDADKLTRRLDALVESAQELAAALADTGGSDFLKDIFTIIKGATEGLTAFIKLLDNLGASSTPLLAALAGKGISKVLGFGGPGGGGGGVGGGTATNQAQVAFGNATQANTAAIQNMTFTLQKLTQEISILMRATMTQSQLTQVDASMQKLNTSARIVNTGATTQNTGAVGANTAAQRNMQSSVLASSLKFVAFTAVASAVGGLMNKLGEEISKTNPEFGKLTQNVGEAAQTGVQFGAVFNSLKGGVIAGTVSIVMSSLATIAEAYNEDSKARKELIQTIEDEKAVRDAAKLVTESQDVAKAIVEAFTKNLSGNTVKENTARGNVDKSLNQAFLTLDPTMQKLAGSANILKEALFRGDAESKKLIFSLSQVSDESFKDQEALKQLRAAFDENGNITRKSTFASNDFANVLALYRKAVGEAAQETNVLTGRVDIAIRSFKAMQDAIELTKAVIGLTRISQAIDDARIPADRMAQGIDLLRIAANRGTADLSAAESQFKDLFKAFSFGTDNIDQEAATGIINTIKDFAEVSGSINDFRIKEFIQSLGTDQQAFAKEFVKAEKDVLEARRETAEASQKTAFEIFKREKDINKDRLDASNKAAEGLAKFRVELEKLGGQEIDLDQLTGLTAQDVGGILAGNSALPQAVQDLIQRGFIDEVQKAENDLRAVSTGLAITLEPLSVELAQMDAEIAKLRNTVPGTENSFKKQELQLLRSGKAAEVEEVKREALIKAMELTIKLADEQQKAEKEAAEAALKHTKQLQDVKDAEHDAAKALHDVNKAFDEFVKQKFADLLQKEADAQTALKESHAGVIDATQGLDEAYRNFISSILAVNGAIAEAQIRSNLLATDIQRLLGGIVTFQDGLTSLEDSFNSVLQDANITLEQRINLERQLAEETLSFLQQARDSIVQAGIGVFGQSSEENNALAQGIAGLEFVAQQLGGSFQSFLNLSASEINSLSQSLLNLPQALREQILNALSFLPSTATIGGFSVDQLRDAIGQIGAGVAPEAGLPSIEELTNQQVEQLKILQNLALQDAQLQISQVIAAEEQLKKAEEQLDVAKIAEERAGQELEKVRTAVIEEKIVLEAANAERRELLEKVIQAGDANALHLIENEAQLFADQNSVFREVGQQIVQGIASAIGGRLAVLEANAALNTATGYIPNFAKGNLTPKEAAGLLKAGAREKRAMPAGAGLAVANTSEAVIPMRNRGFVPNFAGGSEVAEGLEAIRGINQAVVAAIAKSISGGGQDGTKESVDRVGQLLIDLNDTLKEVNENSLAIKTNTAASTTASPGSPTTSQGDVRIVLETNQNSNINIVGLENLRSQLEEAVTNTSNTHVQAQLKPLLQQLESVFDTLQQRGLISSFVQPR